MANINDREELAAQGAAGAETAAAVEQDNADEAQALARAQAADAAAAEQDKKAQRARFGESLGNVLRATGNLVGVAKGGLNTYDSDKAAAQVKEYVDRYDKLSAQRAASSQAMYDYYQKLKSGNAKALNDKELTAAKVRKSDADAAYSNARAKNTDAKTETEKERPENVRSQTHKNDAEAEAVTRNADSNARRAASVAARVGSQNNKDDAQAAFNNARAEQIKSAAPPGDDEKPSFYD